MTADGSSGPYQGRSPQAGQPWGGPPAGGAPQQWAAPPAYPGYGGPQDNLPVAYPHGAVQPSYPQSPQYAQAATGLAMKRRNPVGVWLGLPLITLGIYSLVWYFKIHREMAEFDRRQNVPVAGPLLVILFLGWTLIAPLVSFYNTGTRIANAQRAAGLQPTCNAGIGLLLCFFFSLQSLYYQSELNKIADVYNVPPGTQIALRG